MVAEVTEELKHNMEVHEVHIVEFLVPMRNLCDSPNYGCKYYHMVNSSIGFYSPLMDLYSFGFLSTCCLTLPWLVSVIPHGYICTRVTPATS